MPEHDLKPRQSDANEIRKCCHCHNFFEVPQGYPPREGWKCARCLQGLPLCQHKELTFGRCQLCGCHLTDEPRRIEE